MPSEKPRAVLDTNVLISALHFRNSLLSGIWPPLDAGRYVLVLSPAILAETMEKLRDKFLWEEGEISAAAKAIIRKAEVFHPKTVPDAVPDDPDDNHIIACAVEGRADLIVSGDRHLLALGEYAGIPIVRPADFLRTVGQPQAAR